MVKTVTIIRRKTVKKGRTINQNIFTTNSQSVQIIWSPINGVEAIAKIYLNRIEIVNRIEPKIVKRMKRIP